MGTRSGGIRVGIIGAGQVARARHLPGLRAIPGVKLVGVCNQHRESSSKAAREFDIPRVFGNWEDLIEHDGIDAIVIGAWPYLHCPITLAALDAGKHVLTQARMAMNAREAQRMLDRSRECPKLATMVVPSPLGLVGDAYVRRLIADGFLGTLREVHVTGFSNDLADPATPLGWRQMTKYSGFNMLKLGMLHESASRWVPPPKRIYASASKLIGARTDPETGEPSRVGTADSVQVVTTYPGNAHGTYRLGAAVWHPPGNSIAMHGSRGTLIYDFDRDEVRGAHRSASELSPMPIPDDLRGGWSVEADFIAAIRDGRPVTHTTFDDGVAYMQFTEAVARSSRHQQTVDLPLVEFSNPSL